MFEDCILESSPRWRTHQKWTTLASSALQAAALTVLILVPVLRPDALPRLASNTGLVPPQPFGQPAQERVTSRPPGRSAVIVRSPGALVAPVHVPTQILPGDDGTLPPSDTGGVGTGTEVGTHDGVPGGILNEVLRRPPTVPAATPLRRIVISVLSEGNLVRRVDPVYPSLAKAAGVQGDVILQAVIARDGSIEQLQSVSGHPMLVPAALDAVRQWRYRPYLLNGQPVEVETQITVRFILSGR
jgi:periplasmic protein TonB